jgi:hypothetical protein
MTSQGWETGVRFPVRAVTFLFVTVSSLFIQQLPRLLFPWVNYRGVTLTTHLHLVPTLRLLELYLHSPIRNHGDNVTFTFLPQMDFLNKHHYKNFVSASRPLSGRDLYPQPIRCMSTDLFMKLTYRSFPELPRLAAICCLLHYSSRSSI